MPTLFLYDFRIGVYNDFLDWYFGEISERSVLNGYDVGMIDVNLFKGDCVGVRDSLMPKTVYGLFKIRNMTKWVTNHLVFALL